MDYFFEATRTTKVSPCLFVFPTPFGFSNQWSVTCAFFFQEHWNVKQHQTVPSFASTPRTQSFSPDFEEATSSAFVCVSNLVFYLGGFKTKKQKTNEPNTNIIPIKTYFRALT